MPKVRIFTLGMTATALGAPKVRIFRLGMTSTAPAGSKVRIYRLGMTSTAPISPKVRIYKLGMTATTAAPPISPIAPRSAIEPYDTVVIPVTMSDGSTPDSWNWRVVASVSNPPPALTVVGNTVSFVAPANPAGESVVLGVTASFGASNSPEQNVTIDVNPALKLLWDKPTQRWVGERPAVDLGVG